MNDEVKQLLVAIRSLDKNKIADAINNGVFFQVTEEEKTNYLIYAIQKSCIETAKIMIENGANAFGVSFSEDNDEMLIPMRLAFYNVSCDHRNQAQYTFLEALLTIVPDIFATDVDGNNLAHYACIYNMPNQLQRFIDQGVDINESNDEGETPLFMATRYNYKECVEILINNGASVNAKNVKKETPLFMATFYNHIDCVEMLINNGAIVDARNVKSETPLVYGMLKTMNDAIPLLLKAGASVHNLDCYNRTPLFPAAITDFYNIDLLLEQGADINITDCFGQTPIFTAIEEGPINILLHFLKCKADINHKDSLGYTPLFHAVKYKREDCVKVLLENGADLENLYLFPKNDAIASLSIDQVAKEISPDDIYDMVRAHIEHKKITRHINDHMETCNGLYF